MTVPREFTHSTLSLAILILLAESPMHPYRIQKLLRERGKGDVIKIGARTNIYQTIAQLEKLGLVQRRGTAKEEGFPEQVIYELTGSGRTSTRTRMIGVVERPEKSFLEFPAAISFLTFLGVPDAKYALEHRAGILRRSIDIEESGLRRFQKTYPKVFALEGGYKIAMMRAELIWIERLIRDLGSGAITWNDRWLRDQAVAFEKRKFESERRRTRKESRGPKKG